MLTAGTLYKRGVDLGNAGRHAAARRELTAALARNPDPDLAALIVGVLAYIAAETGDPDAGIEQCRGALADPRIGAHSRAFLAGQLGLIELRRGNSDAAMKHLSTAIARLDDDPARQGRALLNRGLVHLNRSELAQAQRDFARAAAAYERSGEPVEQAKALNNQGYAAMLAGDLVTAVRAMDASRPVLAALSPVAAAVGDSDRAELMLSAGMTSEAVRLLREVARIYGSRRLRQAQAETELVLARALAQESPLEAAAIARRAARRFRSRGSESWAVRADAAALGASLAAGHHSAATLAAARATAAELTAARRVDDASALLLQVARAEARGARDADARSDLAAARVRASAPIGVRLLAGEVRAELAVAAGRPGIAMRHAAEGIDALRVWQATFGSMELQSAASAHARDLAVIGIRAALADGRPETVFDWSERVRALSGHIVGLSAPGDPVAAEELAELRMIRAASPAPRSAAARREAELMNGIRRRRWASDGSRLVAGRAELDTLRSALRDDGAALVAHLWTVDRLSAMVVTGSAATVVDLGPWEPVERLLDGLLADLDMSAITLSPAMRASIDGALRHRLRALDDALVAPLLDVVGPTERVVLTPAGALAGVPWGMLPGLAGRAVCLPGSASEWIAARGGVHRVATAGFAAGPGVARADDEIRVSAARWERREALYGSAATARAVSTLAASVDLLHVAAHGRHSADNPLFSAFELADGPWFGYDIDQLERVPGVVILSACELGRSANRWGLEALGMSRAWLHSGARTVIASPSAVADELADTLLEAAHELLAAGVPPAEAIGRAGAELRVSAPFVVHGSGW